MKKLLYLFSATLLVLTSCSNDDSGTNGTNLILPKQIDSDGDITTLTYNGNKIVQFVAGSDKTVYTYTGNLITKEEEFADGNNIDSKVEYSYENNKLKTSTYQENSGSTIYKGKTEYLHNADGTVSYTKYDVNATTNVATVSYSGKYTFSNGNLIKDVSDYDTTIYEYDAKNSPVKNILGFDKLLEVEFSPNNVLKRTYNSTSSTTSNVSTKQYIYNTDNYPTEEKSFYDGTPNGITKFSY